MFVCLISFFPLSVSDVGSLCLNVFGFGLVWRFFCIFSFLLFFYCCISKQKNFQTYVTQNKTQKYIKVPDDYLFERKIKKKRKFDNFFGTT